MKPQRIVFVLATAILFLFARAYSRSEQFENNSSLPSAESVEAFLGRWDLTLKAPDREYPSWLELRQEGGQLKAQMVGRWGNARPLPKVELSGSHVTFVSPKDEEGSSHDLIFEGQLSGETLTGTLDGPDGKTWQWTGVRAPALSSTATP